MKPKSLSYLAKLQLRIILLEDGHNTHSITRNWIESILKFSHFPCSQSISPLVQHVWHKTRLVTKGFLQKLRSDFSIFFLHKR